MKRAAWVSAVVALVLAWGFSPVLTDGDEILGIPSIPIESGTGLLTGGTGLATSQPGTIVVDVPDDATVKQVLLYWVGRGTGDATATVNGSLPVLGTLIGSSGDGSSFAYRAELSTSLLGPGSNTVTVGDLDFGQRTDGATLVVVIDDGSAPAELQFLDGMDFAWIGGASDDVRTTLSQTFAFADSDVERSGRLLIVLGDGTPDRQDRTEIGVDSEIPTVLCNSAIGRDGPEWDTIVFPVTIPPGGTSVTAQLFSEESVCPDLPGLPDSLSWTLAALTVEPPPDQPPGECWLTAGGTKFDSISSLWSATMKNGNGPRDTVGGVALPSCSEFPSNGGNWNHVSHANKVHLLGPDIELVRCGNVDGIEPGSESPVCSVNFIEFTGSGTLRGFRGNHMDPVPVTFFVRAEDHNEPGNAQAADSGEDIDRYFLRVVDENGALLLLVDADGVDDGNVDPLSITGGNFQIHCTSCD